MSTEIEELLERYGRAKTLSFVYESKELKEAILAKVRALEQNSKDREVILCDLQTHNGRLKNIIKIHERSIENLKSELEAGKSVGRVFHSGRMAE